MARSQNGWTVDTTGARQDRAPLIRDITVPNGVLRGDVATVFRWLAREYDRRVERLVKGWCWGWYVKPIEGSSVISNHSSGTAVDFNAPDNPMGRGTTSKSLTQRQIDECHRLERESGGVLRWGGDFSRNDPMHWEIVGNAAEVAAFARKIRQQDQQQNEPEDDDMTPEQLLDFDAGTKYKQSQHSFGGMVVTTFNRGGFLANDFAPKVLTALEALAAAQRIDEQTDAADREAILARVDTAAAKLREAIANIPGDVDTEPES